MWQRNTTTLRDTELQLHEYNTWQQTLLPSSGFSQNLGDQSVSVPATIDKTHDVLLIHNSNRTDVPSPNTVISDGLPRAILMGDAYKVSSLFPEPRKSLNDQIISILRLYMPQFQQEILAS